MDQRAADLLRDMKTSKGARFNAARRLESQDFATNVFIVVATVLVIALTTIPFVYKIASSIQADLSAITLIASIAILAGSLLQISNNYGVRADQHHRCGLEINELRRQFRNKAQDINVTDLEAFTAGFDEILKRYHKNHDEIDFYKYKLEHRDEFPHGLLQGIGIRLRLMFSQYIIWCGTAAVTAVFIWVVFWHVLPGRITDTSMLYFPLVHKLAGLASL